MRRRAARALAQERIIDRGPSRAVVLRLGQRRLRVVDSAQPAEHHAARVPGRAELWKQPHGAIQLGERGVVVARCRRAAAKPVARVRFSGPRRECRIDGPRLRDLPRFEQSISECQARRQGTGQ